MEDRRRSPRRAPTPLDGTALEALALAYVARFATSTGKLAAYLQRKLRERGWEGQGDAATAAAALVAKFADAGYVDDAAYAQARSSGLLRRGYGNRRIDQALRGAGVGDEDRAAARASEADARRAALRLAMRRGFGPFGAQGSPDRATREKQIAAMLRAGHPLDTVRELIDAATACQARAWAEEIDE